VVLAYRVRASVNVRAIIRVRVRVIAASLANSHYSHPHCYSKKHDRRYARYVWLLNPRDQDEVSGLGGQD